MVDWGRIGKAAATFGMSEGGGLRSALGKISGSDIMSDPGADQERERRRLLYEQAGSASRFADAGQAGYLQLGQQGQGALGGLQRLANGQDSVSAEQLRQGLQQNYAAQRSMAAGAAPQNAAMAARTAAIQSGRIGAGMAGQQALAGLQERQQAQQQYANLLLGLRGQDREATSGARNQAIAGYGGYTTPMTPEKSWLEKYGPLIQSGASLAAAASDRRLKTDIRDGTADANRAMAKIKPESFEYKDPAHGSGRRVGIMAQALERAGLGHAVIDTPQGKAIHGGHLATANTAMVSALAKRLSKLEAKR